MKTFAAICVFALQIVLSAAHAKTSAERAYAQFNEGLAVCKEVTTHLQGKHDLMLELIETQNAQARHDLLKEKTNIDSQTLRKFLKHAASDGVRLGSTLHGAPLSSFVPESDGFYCGAGMKYLRQGEQAGGTKESWKLRQVYLNAYFPYIGWPWYACGPEVSQEEFLERVAAAFKAYRDPETKALFEGWVREVEGKMRIEMRRASATSDAPPEEWASERAFVKKEGQKFLRELKRRTR